jgi:hypothetical protein
MRGGRGERTLSVTVAGGAVHTQGLVKLAPALDRAVSWTGRSQ